MKTMTVIEINPGWQTTLADAFVTPKDVDRETSGDVYSGTEGKLRDTLLYTMLVWLRQEIQKQHETD